MTKAAEAAGDLPEKGRMLGRTPLFAQMQGQALAALAARTRERVIRTGDVLFRRGDPGTTMLVILVGQVRIALPSSDGREQVLRLMQPGEVLGELALLDGGRRTADAIAETNGRLLTIDREDLMAVLRSDPDFALAMTAMICGRLRTATWLLESMLFNDATGRLASTLLILSQGMAGRRVDITQGALGDRVGAARETVNRKLREWQTAGYIALEPGRITLLDPAGLRQFAPPSDVSSEDLPRIW